MADKLKTITLDNDGNEVTLTVKRASALVGVRRYQMMLAAEKQNETEPDEAMKAFRMFTYPDLMAGTVAAEGFDWPITCEAMSQLDEDFINAWAAAVYEVNPGWRGKPTPEDDKKKL